MGQLHDAIKRIEQAIRAKGLPEYKTKGELSLRAGFLLSWVGPQTPDDPEKLAKLKQAAKDLLELTL
jgi:hypothetical protein